MQSHTQLVPIEANAVNAVHTILLTAPGFFPMHTLSMVSKF